MAIKHEHNLVGSVMFVIFLMGSVARCAYEALRVMIGKEMSRDMVEMVLIFPVSLGLLVFLGWVFFDSSWLNFDDEEKDKQWRTSRWVKFSVLFVLPLLKLCSGVTWKKDNLGLWGVEVAYQIQCFLVILLAYLSLSVSYSSGLGRLFQPFTVPRSRIYTDEKGQKFEVNFIGTILSIVLIVWPCWQSLTETLGRLFLFVSNNRVAVREVTADITTIQTSKFLTNTADGRAIADAVVLCFILYSFTVIFFSCVKVNFFLNEKYNYLKFAAIPLTPVAILFTDQLCTYQIDPYKGREWISMMCYVVVSFVAYVSLVSPPDSLTAVLFQPHIPMINIVNDLPDMKATGEIERPRSTAVFPDTPKESDEKKSKGKVVVK